MRSIRTHKNWPRVSDHFGLVDFRGAPYYGGYPIPPGDYMVKRVGPRTMDYFPFTSGSYYVITGGDRKLFETINWEDFRFLMDNGVPSLSRQTLVYAYEKYKSK